ncbi:kinase-like domain-containing protein [Mycena filopes]|nr:kinase-like domain-containing protein [Mycena filopes]
MTTTATYPFPPPEIPTDVEPIDYPLSVWESLRPLLRFHGYRLLTQRDAGLALADVMNRPPAEEWAGPPQIDDPAQETYMTGALFEGFRLSDSRNVILKIVKGKEAQILAYLQLCDPTTSQGLGRKVVPIFAIIPVTATLSIVVTEAWGCFWNYYSDSSETWEDFADFGSQVLEGLTFLHAHKIAHLDISSGNILQSPPPHRIYSFIDFGQSTMCSHAHPGHCAVTGNTATFKAPEMSKVVPYDPFKADVWQMGHFFSLAVSENKFEKEGLQALISKMKHPIPAERPTAEEAWRELCNCRP